MSIIDVSILCSKSMRRYPSIFTRSQENVHFFSRTVLVITLQKALTCLYLYLYSPQIIAQLNERVDRLFNWDLPVNVEAVVIRIHFRKRKYTECIVYLWAVHLTRTIYWWPKFVSSSSCCQHFGKSSEDKSLVRDQSYTKPITFHT